MNDRVSIVIVNWNGKKWLARCLDSLLAQTYKQLEIVFVDNASTDGSATWVKETYPTITIVQNEHNVGFAGGNNSGIKQSNGDYIVLLNTDAWVEPTFIEKIMNRYHELGVDVLAPQQTGYDEKSVDSAELYSIDPLGYGLALDPEKDRAHFFFGTGACLLFSKKVYEETGGLDNDFFMYHEEIDWFWRLHLLQKKTIQVHDIFFHHAEGGSSIDVSKLKYKTFLWRNENILQMLLKNYSWWTLCIMLPIYFIQNLIEILFFLILGKWKIAGSYVLGWVFNIKHLPRTLRKRHKIQAARKVSDIVILKRMYWTLSKVRHLVRFYTGRTKKFSQ